MPVEDRFYRYSVEFISRVFYVGWPAVVVLAAVGAAWSWRAGLIGRAASVVFVSAAVWVGARAWWSWIGLVLSQRGHRRHARGATGRHQRGDNTD